MQNAKSTERVKQGMGRKSQLTSFDPHPDHEMQSDYTDLKLERIPRSLNNFPEKNGSFKTSVPYGSDWTPSMEKDKQMVTITSHRSNSKNKKGTMRTYISHL